MKRRTLPILFSILLLVLLIAVSCSLEDIWERKNKDCQKLVLSEDVISTDVSTSTVFTVTAETYDKDGNRRGNTNVVWEFSVPERISILHTSNNSIMFSVKEAGRIVLTAWDTTASSLKEAVVITATGALRALYISENVLTLNQKESHNLSITYNPEEPTSRNVVWTSSDTSVVQVVKVSETEATITAGVPGKATITVASADNSSIKATCSVTVSSLILAKTDPRYLRLSENYLFLSKVGESRSVVGTIYDGNNEEFSGLLLWESSDTTVASVNSVGNTVAIVARGVGKATITAKVENSPDIYGSVDVSVATPLRGLALETVTLEEVKNAPRSKALYDTVDVAVTGAYPVGETVAYKVSYIPEDATEKSVRWTSDNNLVSLESFGDYVIVKATAAGNAKVIAISNSDPSIAIAASLGIYDPAVTPDNFIQAVSISPQIVELEEGQGGEVLTASIMMQNGTVGTGSILWNTSSPNVTITPLDSQGQRVEIQGNTEGSSVITATPMANPYVSGSAKVYVYKEGEKPSVETEREFSLIPSSSGLVLVEGKEAEITLSPYPDGVTPGSILWTTEDSSVASVSGNSTTATIHALSKGTVFIVARCSSPKETEVSIRVKVITEEEAVDTTSAVKAITLDPMIIQMEEGDSGRTLRASILLQNGTEGSELLSWSSDGSGILVTPLDSLRNTVELEPLQSGSYAITATSSSDPSISGSAKVYVYGKGQTPSADDYSDFSLVAASNALSVVAGDTAGITITPFPSGVIPDDLLWSVGNSSIATVDGNGLSAVVTGLAKGTTTVTARCSSPKASAVSVEIKVIEEEEASVTTSRIRSITVSPSTLEMKKGEGGKTLTASVQMQSGTSGSVPLRWESSSDAVSLTTLDSLGRTVEVFGSKEGSSVITAYAVADDSISGAAKVYVQGEKTSGGDGYSSFSLIPSSNSVTVLNGSSMKVSVSAFPETVNPGSILWNTGNSSIAAVVGDGLSATISGLSRGTTTVTARCSSPKEVSATIDVSVLEESEATSIVSAVKMSDSSMTLTPPFTVDQTGLTGYSYDIYGNQIEDSYTWSVKGNGILSGRTYNGDKQYILTALKPGTAVVTATSKKNPAIKASSTITVSGALESITLSPSVMSLGTGENVSVKAVLNPSDTIENGISWSISGTAAELVQDAQDPLKAIVKGKRKGSATLVVTSVSNPMISRTMNITVEEKDTSTTSFVGSVELSQTTLSIAPPITTPSILTATVYDEEGLIYPTGVSWEITDSSIAEFSTVDTERVSIIAKKAGETRIIARSITDPSIYKTCILTVSGKITKIVPETSFVTLVKGASRELKINLNPSDTIETEMVWTTEGSTDGSTQQTPWVTLRPTSSGCLITAIKTGETTVRVTSATRPEIYADIAVLVVEPEKLAATISISPTPIELSPTANRLKVTATVKVQGEGAVDEDVVFTIDPSNLVDTTAGGSNEIYLVPNGTAGEGTIYASLPSYPYIEPAKARLFVGGSLRSLSGNGSQSVAVNVGDTVSIGVLYNPTNTTETGILWSSSNESVARVNGGTASDAIVTGVSAGTATITARSRHHSDKLVEFTIVVKSIITEVAFTDQFDHQGLIFTTDTETPLYLACKIYPDIERSLIYKPKANTYSMATLSKQDGTINDVIFTPDSAAAGTYEYNITYDNRVIDVLTINTTFKGIAINSVREVFTPNYTSKQLVVTSAAGTVSNDQIKWTSSNAGVATVSNTGLVKSVKPGEAVITASINGGMKLQTRIYVNVDIPASFEKALRIAGYLPASGDTILPSQLESIRTLDFRSVPTTLAIDLSGIQKLPNLNALYLKGTKLSSDTLNLYNSPYLTYVDASDTNIKSVTNVPKGIKTFIATNNVLTSFSFLGSTSVEVVNLANNSISSYTTMTYATDVNLSNNKLTSLSISSERLQKLNVSSNYISSVNINSSTLKNLDLSSNQLWYNNLNLNSNANLKTPYLEILNLNNNKLGLYKDVSCPTCSGKNQAANSTTYSESETQNREQPLRTINLTWLGSLKEIYLQNNHIRSGLNAQDKAYRFNITAGPLVKVDIRGNHIGNYYNFQNSRVAITSLPSSSTYNAGGMVISYDQGGCFYTGRTWNDYWDWFLNHKQYYDYWIGKATMY